MGSATDVEPSNDERSIPAMAMLLDTSSFDETDDFGVDTQMIKSEIWEEMTLSMGLVSVAPPVMMSNGRVRRRLRWKPRNTAKKPKPGSLNRYIAPALRHRATKTDSASDRSLNSCSSASFASWFSKRSVHSFGSMSTQIKNNTTKALSANSFSKSLIESSSVLDGMSSATVKGGTSVFTRQVSELSATSNAASLASERRKGFPPLFKKVAAARHSSTKSPLSTANTRSARTDEDATSVSSSSPSVHDNSAGILSPSPDHQADRSQAAVQPCHHPVEQDVLLALSGEDLGSGQRVNPRIHKSALRRRLSLGRDREHSSPKASSIAEHNSKLSDTEGQAVQQSQAVSPEVALASNAKRNATSFTRRFSNRSHDPKPHDRMLLSSVPESEGIRFDEPEQDNDIFETIGPTFDGVPALLRTGPSPLNVEMSPSGKHVTVPVDVDDGTFLEAEKNLKAIHDMASEHLNQREYCEALEVFEEILRGQLARYGENHYRIGTALHNIAIVQMRRGDYQKAIDIYQDAVSIRKLSLSPGHPDVAVSLAQLGVAYLEAHQHKNAIEVFREALKIRREFYGSMHPKVAKVLNNIGCALYELNEVEVAQVAFDEALEIQRFNLEDASLGSNQLSNVNMLGVASTLSNIGCVKLYLTLFDEAQCALEESLYLQKCVYGEGHPIPRQTENSLRWIEQSTTFNHHVPSYINFFSQLAKTFTMTRSDSFASSSQPQRGLPAPCSSGAAATRKITPLTHSLLEAVERKLEDGMKIACGEASGQHDDEHQSQYSF